MHATLTANPSMVRNPVEQRLAALHDLWWEQTQTPGLRAIVLRAPAHSQRMLDAFLSLQESNSAYSTPDVFIRFDAPFETGFSYSRALRQALVDGYLHNREQLAAQGIAEPWADAQRPGWDSAAGFIEAGTSFARHCGMQQISAVLRPHRISSVQAFHAWMDAALRMPADARSACLFRLVLIDDDDTQACQPLVERHRGAMRVIEAPVDMLEAARDVAAQSGGGGGPQVLYRQLFADLMLLLNRRDAATVQQHAERAMKLARQHDWHDQRAVIDTVVGSAWLKARDYPRSIARYRLARDAAQAAAQGGSPAGPTLVMQSWFAEAGAWVAAGDLARAAETFEQAAVAASKVPNAMFAVEGYRCAGQCWYQAKKRDKAQGAAMQALREARAMAPGDRANTTVPQLLHDLLRLQDEDRAARLADCAQRYLAAVANAQQEADAAAHRLGPRPDSLRIRQIEDRMLRHYGEHYSAFLHAREQLVARGSEVFRTVIAIGRDWLQPAWSGLPDVRHPLDQEIAQWRDAPAFVGLPDPEPMIQAA